MLHIRSLLRRRPDRLGGPVVVAGGAIVFVLGVVASPASALDLGAVSALVPTHAPVKAPTPPVALPVASPAKVSVAVPPAMRVGPTGVDSGKIAPGLGASVSVSPAPGVGVDVTLPTSVGPVPLPAGTLPPINASVGPDGATVSTPAVGVTLPGATAPGVTAPGVTVPGVTVPGVTIPGVTVPGVPAVPGAPTVPGVPTVVDVPAVPGGGPAGSTPTGSSASGSSVPASSASGAARSDRSASGSVGAASEATSPIPSGGSGVPRASISGATPAREHDEQLGSVNASLRHEAPQSSTVWRAISAVATRQGLLIALAVLVLVARLAAGGLLREALRRPPSAA